MTATVGTDPASAPNYDDADPESPMSRTLTQNWWLLALRGLLAMGFGAIAIFFPGSTVLALVLLFSAYVLMDGVCSLVAAIRAARRRQKWILMSVHGLASIATAALAFLWPQITVLVFVLLIAAWAIVSGVLYIGSAFRVSGIGEGLWLALGGIASLVFGILVIMAPMVGALVLTWWIGAYTIVLGVALIMLAVRLRARRDDGAANGYAQPVA